MFIALLLAWAPSPALKLPSPPPLRPARCAVARRINEVRAAASVPRESVGGPIEALVTAVQGSQASALNAELVKAKDANAVLALTSARDAGFAAERRADAVAPRASVTDARGGRDWRSTNEST